MVMKKLIVFSVVFALVAGAAFAEVSFGGTVFGKVDVVGGSSVKDSDITAGGGMGRINVDASAESEDGTFGGWMRFRAGGYGAGASGWGLAWWKPIEMVKFQIGNNPDGIFDTSHMTRWGFYQVAGDVGVVNAGNAWGGGLGGFTGGDSLENLAKYFDPNEKDKPGLASATSDFVFFGGFGGFGAMLSITPIDLLALNFVFPYAGGPAENTYKKLIAQAVVNLDGIGQFSLTYQAGKGEKDYKAGTDAIKGIAGTPVYEVLDTATNTVTWETTKPDPTNPADATKVVLRTQTVGGTPDIPAVPAVGYDESPGKLFASFYFSMIENLGLDLGFSFTLPTKTQRDDGTLNPLGLGLGVQFGAGQFGIKSRILTSLGGKYVSSVNSKGDTETAAIPLGLTFDLLPSFAINDNLTAFLSVGLGLSDQWKWMKDTPNSADYYQALVNFHINPYVQYKFDWSKGLFAGFLLESKGSYQKKDAKGDAIDPVLTWSIPVGLYITF